MGRGGGDTTGRGDSSNIVRRQWQRHGKETWLGKRERVRKRERYGNNYVIAVIRRKKGNEGVG